MDESNVKTRKGEELEGYCQLSGSQVEGTEVEGEAWILETLEEFLYVTSTNFPIMPQRQARNRFSECHFLIFITLL